MCGSLRLHAPHEGILSPHFPALAGVGTSPKKTRHPGLLGLRLTRGLGVVDLSLVPFGCKSIRKIQSVSDEIESVKPVRVSCLKYTIKIKSVLSYYVLIHFLSFIGTQGIDNLV